MTLIASSVSDAPKLWRPLRSSFWWHSCSYSRNQ